MSEYTRIMPLEEIVEITTMAEKTLKNMSTALSAVNKNLTYKMLVDKSHGKWIKHEIEDTCRWIECSECHKEYPNIEMNFCPNCGKDMRENKKKKENNNTHKVPLYAYVSWDRSEE